jgi:hypothetical protein
MASSVFVKRYEFIPFPSNNHWDRDMTTNEIGRLSGFDKKSRTHVSLIRKVALAQTAAENPGSLPPGITIPLDRKRLREWHDPKIGLWPWADVKLDYEQGDNKEIIEAFFQALAEITDLRAGNQSKLRRELAEQKIIIGRLERRTAELLQRISRLQKIMADAGLHDF